VADDGLVIRRNRFGRGVYATRRFRRGEVVCSAPVLVWPTAVACDAFIGKYAWSWQGHEAVPLGLISLFNHSDRPNTGIRRLYRQRRMICNALRTIEPGAEITIDYGAAADAFEYD
jgi:uncharacterized protein